MFTFWHAFVCECRFAQFSRTSIFFISNATAADVVVFVPPSMMLIISINYLFIRNWVLCWFFEMRFLRSRMYNACVFYNLRVTFHRMILFGHTKSREKQRYTDQNTEDKTTTDKSISIPKKWFFIRITQNNYDHSNILTCFSGFFISFEIFSTFCS